MGRKQQNLDEAIKKLQANGTHLTLIIRLKLAGIDCLAIQGDVRKPETIEKALAEVVAKYGHLDILVNNAAGNFMCSAEDISLNAFQTVIEIDLQVSLRFIILLLLSGMFLYKRDHLIPQKRLFLI
jgi:peroxisomal 2,4-dienoyl-CoA reductase